MHSLFAAGLVLAIHALSGSASPIAAPQVTPGPLLAERATSSSCSFSGSVGAASASKSKTSCATITLNNIAVPSGTTLDLTGLNDGTSVIFEGTTTFGYKEWSGPLISVSGKDITVTGASGNLIDGGGARWWDGQGTNGGKTKPKFFYAHSLTGKSVINGLNIQNTPVQVFSVNSATGLTIEKVVIDNSAGDSQGGHNTDCYDVGSSTDITISGAVCKNQDDCLAINSGTGITFTGGTCSGGHGLSIGSVGGRSDNTVQNILIENSSISNSQNGVRIKTVYGATGSVSGVEYKSITLSNISKYGIVIEQDYENGSPTGTPTSGVPISNLTLASVTGSVASSATDIYILCASCSDFTFTGVSVTGGKKSTQCEGVPSGVSC